MIRLSHSMAGAFLPPFFDIHSVKGGKIQAKVFHLLNLQNKVAVAVVYIRKVKSVQIQARTRVPTKF